jgi:hypothetical protein
MIDGVLLYMLILAGVFVPLSAFVAYMAHRQRLEEEAEEAERDAQGTAAE